MMVRFTPRRVRVASRTFACGMAFVLLAGPTGCGTSPTTQAPAQYSPMPTEKPSLSVAAAKPGTVYTPVPQFRQGE